MQARSALFDLYGDHLRARGGRAPVAALVRLLSPLGIAAPAVRTAVSRMVRQGWLRPVRLSAGPGYQLTTKALHRLDEAASRIYRIDQPTWNGCFDLLILTGPDSRTERSRLAATLTFLGYGRLGADAWLAPRPSTEVESVLTEAGVGYDRFSADPTGRTEALVRRAWDLDAIASAYRQFVIELQPIVIAAGGGAASEEAFAARSRLVHAWRRFLFTDPQLPAELLPTPWAGTAAAAFFDHHEARLRPAADRFVDTCLPVPEGNRR
jgi:phenylacetic acid degradation operon negative regulatory protein